MRAGWGPTQQQLLTVLSASTEALTAAGACAAAGLDGHALAYPSLHRLEASGLVRKIPAPAGSPRGTRIAWLITDEGRARATGVTSAAPDAAMLAEVVWGAIKWGATPITEPSIESWLRDLDDQHSPGRVGETLAWLAASPHALIAGGPDAWELTGLGQAVCGMPEAEWAELWLCLDLLGGWNDGGTGMSGRAAAGVAEWAGLGDIGTRHLDGYQDAWTIAGNHREVTWCRLSAGDSRYLLTIRGQRPDGTWATAYETLVLELGDVAYATREIIGRRSPCAPVVWKPGEFFQANDGGQDPDYSAVRQRLSEIIGDRDGPAGPAAAGQAI